MGGRSWPPVTTGRQMVRRGWMFGRTVPTYVIWWRGGVLWVLRGVDTSDLDDVEKIVAGWVKE